MVTVFIIFAKILFIKTLTVLAYIIIFLNL